MMGRPILLLDFVCDLYPFVSHLSALQDIPDIRGPIKVFQIEAGSLASLVDVRMMLGDLWALPTLVPALRLLRADTEEDRQAEWFFAAKKSVLLAACPKEALIQRGKVPPPAASEEEAHEFTIAGAPCQIDDC